MSLARNLATAALMLYFFSCSHYNQLEKNGQTSKHGGSKSHNAGQDCMSCHNNPKNEASREAWWNVAGTIYKLNIAQVNPNARIELWSEYGAKGIKILALETDNFGNFYTEKIVSFKGGSYPIAISNHDTLRMSGVFSGGGCNGCHGISTPAIKLN